MPNKIKMPSERRFKEVIIGRARKLSDSTTFHRISLIAFLAWIGLGADGISSSSYGPEEAYRYLGQHHYLALFVALGTIITIFIISTSYKQIIRLFPHGGGGYLVATKLISPFVGMISGSALLIDYLLTITLSISSGADAIFSFLPESFHPFRLIFATGALVLMIVLNLRGVKESVMTLVPIFMLFILTHIFLILYIFFTKSHDLTHMVTDTSADLHNSVMELGLFGTLFIIMKAYSMGAGTYTGIEAVSNGMPILREPKVVTASRTMTLMAFSLSILVLGLMVGYSLYAVQIIPGRTLNAVLLESATQGWEKYLGFAFISITLFSEAILLFVAAQTGFLDGPRIMANMAADQWFPKRFASLSDRLVNQRGIVLMGLSAIILMIVSGGRVSLLIVLYSINVFITFSLSQMGMVHHWWIERKKNPHWIKGIIINGIGLLLTGFILTSVIIIKFGEGGWVTLLITGTLVVVAINIRKHYDKIKLRLHKLRVIALKHFHDLNKKQGISKDAVKDLKFDKEASTAIILVSGFGGTGLTTLLKVVESFKETCTNIIFVRIGVINSGNFKGSKELGDFKEDVIKDGLKYIHYANQLGHYARYFWTIGTDPVQEIDRMIPRLLRVVKHPTFFGGQLVFPERFVFERMLHNHTIFAVQRKLFKRAVPVIILPIVVPDKSPAEEAPVNI